MRLAPVALLLACACSRSFPTPPPARPGTAYGTVLYQQPGGGELAPAAGAVLRLLDGTASTTARADGSFLLEGIRSRSAVLLVAFDADGDGAPDRSRVLHLAEYGGGPGRDVALGQVVVSRTATVEGRVRRADALDQPGGNGGSVVFVPQGPFTATTADDGSFRLANLPEGRLSLSVFRAGYLSQEVGELDLRAGERLVIEDVVLTPASGPQPPGSLAGQVALDPAGDLASTRVEAVDPEGARAPAAVAGDGTFRLDGLPAGLYALELAHDGYAPARLENLLVPPGGLLQLQAVTLTVHGQAGFDAGFSPADAGPAHLDAGSTPDGGPITADDGGPGAVASQPAADAGVGSPYFAQVTFDQDVEPTDLSDPARFGLTGPRGEVPGRVLYDASARTATFIPQVPLGPPGDPPRSLYTLHAAGVRARAFPFLAMRAPLQVRFAARPPLLQRWGGQDLSPGVSYAPGIAWTPGDVVLLGRRQDATCPSAATSVAWGYRLPDNSGGLSKVDVGSGCELDDSLGNVPHRAVTVGTTAYACSYPGGGGSTDYVLWQAGPQGWTQRDAIPACNLGTDGVGLYSVSSYSGLELATLDTRSGTFGPAVLVEGNGAVVDRGAGVGGGLAELYVAGAFENGVNLTVALYCSDTTSGAVARCGQAPNADDLTGDSRVFAYRGRPLLTQARLDGASWHVRALYPGADRTPGGSWDLDQDLGGGPLGSTQFDAVLRGGALFVITQEGGGIYLQHAAVDDPASPWVPDPGPNPADPVTGRSALNNDPACAGDSPTLTQGPDGLWAAWSETCGGSPPEHYAKAVRVY